MKNRSLSAVLVLLVVAAFPLGGCQLSLGGETPVPEVEGAPKEIPTWTPRPGEDLEADRSSPEPAAAAPTATFTPRPIPTEKKVTVEVVGGNLNLRRGPSVNYNPVGVLEDGQVVVASARDLVRRWLLVENPVQPGTKGWVSTLTEFTRISGDVSSLPVLKVDPPSEAVIRNCTKHRMLVQPTGVELLGKFEGPYNEERFSPGVYQVFDLDAGTGSAVAEIDLREGLTVDIRRDGNGEKSKCE